MKTNGLAATLETLAQAQPQKKVVLRGNPEKVYPYVRQIVNESNGAFAAVSESEIRETRSMVEEMEGLSPCFTSSAALAGMIRMLRKGALPPTDTVLVNLTGRDREPASPGRIHWLKASGDGWEPADPNDETTQQLWHAPARVDSQTLRDH